MNSSTRKLSTKCPRCGEPHHYREVKFSAINDRGYWKLPCNGCVINLLNPESGGASYHVPEKREGTYAGPSDDVATEVAIYDLQPDKIEHRFNYASAPIFVCDRTQTNLELAAREAFVAVFEVIKKTYSNAINVTLAVRSPDYDNVVIHVPVACPCGHQHVATFYADFLLSGSIQQSLDEYLLADVTDGSLEDQIAGLFTKTDAMAILEKLLIRWHLTSKAIIVASPFVGHQWMKAAEKMEIWNWLLRSLDPNKAVFITRGKEFTSFKSLLHEVEGLDYQVLEEYGLQSRLVAADTKKQDFHAKFFIGMSETHCEVLSGSANLLNGKSIENLSFKAISPDRCASRYLDMLNVKLPELPTSPRDFVVMRLDGEKWTAKGQSGSPLGG